MNRRSFLLALPFIPKILTYRPKFAWDKIRYDVVPVNLMGVPYHQSDATTGTWLGFDRSVYPQFSSKVYDGDLYFDMKKLIDKMKQDIGTP